MNGDGGNVVMSYNITHHFSLVGSLSAPHFMVEYVHVWRVCCLNGMTAQGLSRTGVDCVGAAEGVCWLLVTVDMWCICVFHAL